MIKLASRFRRLDDILADLPVEEPMLLSELDGYLTGVAVCREPIPPAGWLPPIWGGRYGESAPFEDPIDVRLFADMVLARYMEVVRDLGRGRLKPIFDVDERNGDVLWEPWLTGFELAMTLQPAGWAPADDDAAAALAALQELIAIVHHETELTSVEINAISDEAAALLPGYVMRLRTGQAAGDVPPDRFTRSAKVGRNDPCPCGSGRKHKRCCGAAEKPM
jgi:uncharacterized protein